MFLANNARRAARHPDFGKTEQPRGAAVLNTR